MESYFRHVELRANLSACLFLAILAGVARAENNPLQKLPACLVPIGDIVEYRTRHFVVHTDLPQAEADAYITRMDAALKVAEKYWKHDFKGQVECYLANDIANWPAAQLPHPLARVWIGKIGGATVTELTRGHHTQKVQATIFASSSPGVVEHEVIHAYCCQTFGCTGPDWYKEGMAEYLSQTVAGNRPTLDPKADLAELRKLKPLSVDKIVTGGNFTRSTSRSLSVMLNSRTDQNRLVPLSDWGDEESQSLEDLKISYAWSCLLCQFLAENPDYAPGFRRLGKQYLAKRNGNFITMFGPVLKQIEREFAEFASSP